MAKEKKITVKFYPVLRKGNLGNYIIYCRITYDRKTAKFPIGAYFDLSENFEEAKIEFNSLIEDKNYTDFNNLKLYLESVVRYEIHKYKNNFSIIGIGGRIKKYNIPLSDYLVQEQYKIVSEILKDTLTYNQYMQYYLDTSKIDKVRDNYTYLLFYFEELKQEYNIKLIEQIPNNSVFIDLLMVLFFVIFDTHISNQKRIKNFSGLIKIGEWLSNQNDVKNKFNTFLNQYNCNKLFSQYSANIYWIKQELEIEDKEIKSLLPILAERIEELLLKVTP